MYSAGKLNKQVTIHTFDYSFPNLEPVPCSMSDSNCCFLTCIQISQGWSGIPISKNFPKFVVFYTVKSFIVVNEAELEGFMEFSSFFYDPTDVGNLISGSPDFSNSNVYIWKFSIHVLLKPSLKDFEHYLTSMWKEHNFMVVWTFFDAALFWGFEWKLIFSSPVATAEFSKFAGILSAVL